MARIPSWNFFKKLTIRWNASMKLEIRLLTVPSLSSIPVHVLASDNERKSFWVNHDEYMA
jgi:hypothetical protein